MIVELRQPRPRCAGCRGRRERRSGGPVAAARGHGHGERVDHQAGALMVLDSPAQHPTRAGLADHRQVEPALTGGHTGRHGPGGPHRLPTGSMDSPCRAGQLARGSFATPRCRRRLRGYIVQMLHSTLDAIRLLPPVLGYTIIALLVFGEAAVFVGFVLPGETAVLLGGFLANQGRLHIVTLVVIVVISAVVGDTVGYEVGKHLGPRVLRLGILRKHEARLDKARDMLRRRGGPAVFLGRWTAFFRAVMPGIAGLSRMRYPTFLVWNALGGTTWGITFSLVGYFAGASYQKVASNIGEGAAVVVALLVVAGLVVWRVRRSRRERAG